MLIWNGNVYTVSGIYIDTLGTIDGCDSIVTMDMTIHNSIATNDSAVTCDSILGMEMYTTRVEFIRYITDN